MNIKHTHIVASLGVVAALLGASHFSVNVAVAQSAARIRVVHASPDAPAVDVYVNGTKAFANATYKAITPYAETPAGSKLIQVVPTGKTIAQGPVVISATIKVEAARYYSVLAVGKLSDIAPVVLADDNTLPEAGKAYVRFVHASPNAPAVDVIVPAANNLKLFTNIAFKGVGKYTPVDAGTYNVSVRVAGTDSSALEVKGLTLDEKTVYTIYAFGLANGTPALSAGVSVDAKPEQVKIILPVTGGDADERGSMDGVVAVAVGILLVTASVLMRRMFNRPNA